MKRCLRIAAPCTAKEWTSGQISTINRNKYLQLRLDRVATAFLSCPPSARMAGRDAFQFSQIQATRLLPSPWPRRKGLLPFHYARRPRQIPPLCRRIRTRRGTEGGAYPQRLADHGELCRPRLWAASGTAGEGIGSRSRFKPQSTSRRLSGGFNHHRFQRGRRTIRTAGRH